MEAGSIIRIAMLVMGIVLMTSALWSLSVKKMTADFTVIWEIVGVILVVMGAVFRLPAEKEKILKKEALFVVCVGASGLIICYLFCLLISRLMTKNHELAIETSLLLQENEKKEKKAGKDLLIILPVKNEEKNLHKVLGQLSSLKIKEIADILCINDASSDTSSELIDKYQCIQIRNIYGLGYGGALQTGYKYAVRNNYQYVIQMDADGQHDACNIPVIYEKLQEKGEDGKKPDIVLASRFMEGSSEFQVSAVKKFAFWLFRSMIYMATGRKIADPTTGLQGLGKEAFTYYSGYNNFDYQYPDANMIMQMLLLQFRLTEVPAVMHAREDGKSMHSGIEPIGYMARMFLSVVTVVFRVKLLKIR